MRTLILHIGNHKTGTTTLQRCLTNSTEALRGAGIQYLSSEAKPTLHPFLTVNRESGLVPGGGSVTKAKALRALMESAEARTAIASSENFAFLFDTAQIERLQNLLAASFDRVRIVCYVRRQDAHLVSHHQEASKPYRRAERDLFGTEPVALPAYDPRHRLYLDYNERLGKWADVFGEDNMTVRLFERSALKDQDIVADFMDLIGHPDVKMTHPGTVNSSTGMIRTKSGHLMGQAELSESLRAQLHGKIPQGERMLPARAEAEAYYAHYRDSNRALNRRFGVHERECLFDEDFSMYPERARQDWDEDTANQALLASYRAMAGLFDGIDPDHLRDAAIVLETVRPELSLRLMTLAARLRQEGPLIQSKLKKYRAMKKTD